MKSPRVGFTVGLLIFVPAGLALVALLYFATDRIATLLERQSLLEYRLDGERRAVESSRKRAVELERMAEVMREGRVDGSSPPEAIIVREAAERARAEATYHEVMAKKYARAVSWPWPSVEKDPTPR
jgi:hypothetical protein